MIGKTDMYIMFDVGPLVLSRLRLRGGVVSTQRHAGVCVTLSALCRPRARVFILVANIAEGSRGAPAIIMTGTSTIMHHDGAA